MILWDTAHDRFTPGQWFRGSVHSFSLSPDGELVVYHAVKHSPTAQRSAVGSNWTAVSAPPAFEALHLWPVSTWVEGGGGGVFQDDRTLELHHHENDLPPSGTRLGDLRVVHGNWIQSRELPRRPTAWVDAPAREGDGDWRRSVWSSPGSGKRGARACPAGVVLARLESVLPNGAVERRYALQLATGDELPLPGVDFAAFDPRGRLILARDGSLLVGELTDGRLEEHTLANFRDDQPDPKPWTGAP